MWKIAFRGDRRAPRIIFLRGFQRTNTESNEVVFEAQSPGADVPSYTVAIGSAVCLTARFEVATGWPQYAGGPISESDESTWVYAVAIDTGAPGVRNVHGYQVTSDVIRTGGPQPGLPSAPRWTLYAQEIAV